MTTPAATWEKISSLTPWDRNPRDNAASVASVAASIERFGFGAPVIARTFDRVVIAGHTRLLAAKQLGLTEVPVRFLDLDPAEAAALALADNKLGELADWDDELLADVLRDLEVTPGVIDGLGWSDAELTALIGEVEVEPDDIEPGEVAREKTAPTRIGLSVPFQVLVRYGYLDGSFTFLDYGCGKGGDVKAALALGVDARGYDPHFYPHPPSTADVVNLAFVLNVIEDIEERRDVLFDAFSKTRVVLSVGFLGNASGTRRADGVVTSIGTFQRAFRPGDAQAYLAEHLPDVPKTWMGNGTALVFADAEAESDYHRRRRRDQLPLSKRW